MVTEEFKNLLHLLPGQKDIPEGGIYF